jgi:hypothetical protein
VVTILIANNFIPTILLVFWFVISRSRLPLKKATTIVVLIISQPLVTLLKLSQRAVVLRRS